ncbi:E3 ubiquitin-protein ligase TRIM56-like [Gigantopelta aegis]|uniref:E3 ubiquitin-protein ligase TRIM56-like n=1 Tax=Gigantopelta aegis TaxID=1735272 RepID=UPI001B88D3EA|nr:E3 ubiquitin-protein ligase TRIM56-like [Gigantopelta aegis]
MKKMASKEDILLTTAIRDDFLTCKICFNIYEQPKILPCVHTYCTPCLEKLLKTSDKPGSISCPECRECVTLPHKTVSDLKTNFFINSLIEVLKVKTNKDVKCTTCTLHGKTSPAKSSCLDCGDYLCQSCSDGHNTSSATWKHRQVLLEDIKKGSYDKEVMTLHRLSCTKHKDKQIEYFCDTCHTPICLSCVVLLHRDHECLTVTEAVTAQKGRLVSHATKVKEKLQHLEKEKKVACENPARINNHQTQATANIEKQINVMMAKIGHHRQQALQLVKDGMEETLKQCNSEVEQANVKITLAKGCLEFCETMIEQGKDEEVLYLEEIITKRLQQLEELPTVDLKPITREVFPDINEQTCGIQDLDSLLTTHLDKIKLSSNSSSLESDKSEQKVSFQLLRSFDTEYDSDDKSPVVKSMTISDNTVFLSDNANGKIKCISTRWRLQNSYTTDEIFESFAVAVCKDVIGAVDGKYLYMFSAIFNTSQKLLLCDEPNTGSLFTFALANYKDEGFIVGNLPNNHLRIYAIDGTLTRQLKVQVAKPLANVSVTKSGHLLTCEWGDSCVHVRNLQGETLTICQVPSAWRVLAAKEDRNGLIYVVNSFKSTISVFDQSGSHLLQHVTKRDGLQKPVNLAFDDEGLMYLVNSSGKINVYKISVERVAEHSSSNQLTRCKGLHELDKEGVV